MKIAIIVGTRPEIIKMSPIIRECERLNIDYFILKNILLSKMENLRCRIISTRGILKFNVTLDLAKPVKRNHTFLMVCEIHFY